jgi:TPP-dependent 2-oxoacid decarboxylase
MAATISMGQYLFKRVAELGNEHVFGVPGDFNRRSLFTSTFRTSYISAILKNKD